MAKSQAGSYRKVIVSVGIGRFLEANVMGLGNFAYIVVDPNINTSKIEKRRDVKSAVKFDTYSSIT